MFKKLTMVAATLIFMLMPLEMVAAAEPVNLIANPSAETSADGITPDNWLVSNWGTNTATFTHGTDGHTSSRSLKAEITTHTDGAANWYYAQIPVAAGQTYEFSNWYQSNVDTEVGIEMTMTNGTVSYAYLGSPAASTGWNQFKTTYVIPAGVTSVTIFQVLDKIGYVISDDYSLSTYATSIFSRPIVSVTLDDGWTNQYTNALPTLRSNGIKATFYVMSGELDSDSYMNATQIKALSDAGHEIGSHSITHSDLTTLSATEMAREMSESQTTLQTVTGKPVTNFAYPYGSYDNATILEGSQHYASQRTVDRGLNTKDNLSVTKLKIQEVDSDITTAQVMQWVNEAIAQKAWLILCYHEITTTPNDPAGIYTSLPTDFAAQMAYIKSSGITALSVAQALQEVTGIVVPPVLKPGDLNGDNAVDALDLSTMLTNWNKIVTTTAQGDVNTDGTVDALDLSILLTNWSN